MADPAEFMSLIETILEVGPGAVSFDDDLETIGWDSLSDLSFIAESDTRWNVTIDPEDLAASNTPEDLLALVSPR